MATPHISPLLLSLRLNIIGDTIVAARLSIPTLTWVQVERGASGD
ncbi:hypothetical protein [Chroococcidiopsis sp.]